MTRPDPTPGETNVLDTAPATHQTTTDIAIA